MARQQECRKRFLSCLEERSAFFNQKPFALNAETDGDTICNEANEVVAAAAAIGRDELNIKLALSRWSLIHRTEWSVQQRASSVDFVAFSK